MNNKLIIECMGVVKGKSYGFQEYLLNLLDYMHSHREELNYKEVILVCKPSQKDFFSRYSSNFTIIPISGSESYIGRLFQQTLLPLRLHLHKKDTYFFPGNLSGMLKLCKHVLVIHDLLFKHRNLLHNKWMIYQRELFTGPSLRLADRVIGISEFTAKEICQYYPYAKRKTQFIYNDINFEKFECTPTNEDDGYFLAVSANYFHKDLVTLFQAYDNYCKKGGKRLLKLIGSINKRSASWRAYKNMSKDACNKISFMKDLSNKDMGLLYKHASAFISTSLYEGFGMPIAEAMWFGLPVFLADTKIHHEISMNKAVFFPKQDGEALSELMLNESLYRRDYGSIIHARYSEQNTSAKYISLLNEMNN